MTSRLKRMLHSLGEADQAQGEEWIVRLQNEQEKACSRISWGLPRMPWGKREGDAQLRAGVEMIEQLQRQAAAEELEELPREDLEERAEQAVGRAIWDLRGARPSTGR